METFKEIEMGPRWLDGKSAFIFFARLNARWQTELQIESEVLQGTNSNADCVIIQPLQKSCSLLL